MWFWIFIFKFNHKKIDLNIDEKINSEHKRGWGVQLMKELMDTVEFETTEDGTTVTMTKVK